MKSKFYPFSKREDFPEFVQPYLVTNDSIGRAVVEAFEVKRPHRLYYQSAEPITVLTKGECFGGKFLKHPVIGDALVVDEEIDGFDPADNDHADAFYMKAYWAHSGEMLTDDQLNELAQKYPIGEQK